METEATGIDKEKLKQYINQNVIESVEKIREKVELNTSIQDLITGTKDMIALVGFLTERLGVFCIAEIGEAQKRDNLRIAKLESRIKTLEELPNTKQIESKIEAAKAQLRGEMTK